MISALGNKINPFLRSDNRRLVSSAFLLQVATAGLSYLAILLMARNMKVEEFGKYTYLNSWVMMIAILAGFGLPQSVVQLLGKYSSKNEPGKSWGLVRYSYQFSFFTSSILSLSMYFVCNYLGDWDDSWVLCAMLVPIFTITNLQVGLGRVVEKVATALVVTHVIRHLTVISWVLLGLLVSSQVPANELFIAVGCVSLMAIIQQGRKIIPRFQWSDEYMKTEEKRDWLKASLPFLGLTVGMFLIEQVDLLLIGFFKGEKGVALYAVASKVAYLVSFIYVAMTTSLAPKLSRLHHSGDKKGLRQLVDQAGKLMIGAAIAAGLLVVGFHSYILSLMGEQYLPVANTLIILVAAHVLFSFVGLSDSLLSMSGMQKDTFVIYLCSIITNIVLSIVLIPLLGLKGAAIGHLVSKFFFLIGIKWIVNKKIDLRD
ncbi:MAG: flippase [Bdellovibrionales bacterium]